MNMGDTTKIYLAADGFGEDLKNAMLAHLRDHHPDLELVDLGTDTYFDAAGKVGNAVSNDSASSRGVLVCGTGMGVGMVANNFAGVRAATVENLDATRFARAVNDANVLCLGQLITPVDQATKMMDAFLDQKFNEPPLLQDGKVAPWWNETVEKFLSTSHEGITRVENAALDVARAKK